MHGHPRHDKKAIICYVQASATAHKQPNLPVVTSASLPRASSSAPWRSIYADVAVITPYRGVMGIWASVIPGVGTVEAVSIVWLLDRAVPCISPLVPRATGIAVLVHVACLERGLSITTSSGAKGVQFGGDLCLRLDEGAAVIAHWLVSNIRVLRENGKARSDEDHNDEDESEDSVEEEMNHTHDTHNKALW